MHFQLQNVIPLPLEEQDISGTQVWRKQVDLKFPNTLRLQAASGKGKSTFIHILYGRRRDYKGTVLLNNEDVSKFSNTKWAELRQRHLSIIFQELMLFPELTGRENIELKRVLTNFYPKEKIDEFAVRLGAKKLLEKQAQKMSFGERQRIAIIRALMQPFEWLLADEPFSHLDAENSFLASALMAEECKARGAGLMVTALGADNYFDYAETIFI